MASFVIHTIAAKRFLKVLEEQYNISISETLKDEFVLSNLIVDSSKIKFGIKEGESISDAKKRHRLAIQDEKIKTHFRSNDDLEQCIQSPKLELFTNKYQELLKKGNIKALGYLFHLYTDKVFFEELFPKSFDTLDENYTITDLTNKTRFIHVNKSNKICSMSEFWDITNPESIYHDYTVMNKILLETYQIGFDSEYLQMILSKFTNPGIEEVDFANITSVIKKTAQFIQESYDSQDKGLNIFEESQIISFIENVAISFINTYAEYLGVGNTPKTFTRH